MRGEGLFTERAPNGRFQWQLKAMNGRVVAVSSSVHESSADAERAFAELVALGPALVARITHVRDGLGWTWVVPGPRGNPLVKSSRAYERYATCQNAFRRFMALVARMAEAGAQPAAGAKPVTGAQPAAVGGAGAADGDGAGGAGAGGGV
ncbi:DUF1508 domain-containing protein [Kitasatospora cineracea]|uniref:Uncharacterized protein DUF1508 n=1 Tax=Kitasatospora cineracea TaxID=88074 RepID=A0A3N4RS22_9ACTN|nr:DUF1508 domain-containing protein [Kitasatospora cineracea]RPE36222.1 uncharacterized protein DUF1508 [Kitasatospora cineracea]